MQPGGQGRRKVSVFDGTVAPDGGVKAPPKSGRRSSAHPPTQASPQNPKPPAQTAARQAAPARRGKETDVDLVAKRVIQPDLVPARGPSGADDDTSPVPATQRLAAAQDALQRVRCALAATATQRAMSKQDIDTALAQIVDGQTRIALMCDRIQRLKDDVANGRVAGKQKSVLAMFGSPRQRKRQQHSTQASELRLRIEDLKQASMKQQNGYRIQLTQLSALLQRLRVERNEVDKAREELLAEYESRINNRKGGLVTVDKKDAAQALSRHTQRAVEAPHDVSDYSQRAVPPALLTLAAAREGRAGGGTAAARAWMRASKTDGEHLEDAFLTYAPLEPLDVWQVMSDLRHVKDLSASLFDDNAVDRALADARMLVALHSHGVPWSSTVPLFFFTKKWLAPAIRAAPSREQQCSPSAAGPDGAHAREGGHWHAKVVDDEASLPEGQMVTNREAREVAYKANTVKAMSGWKDAVLWLPPPADVFDNEMKAVLPPSHVLEYIYSRPVAEVTQTAPSGPGANPASGVRRMNSTLDPFDVNSFRAALAGTTSEAYVRRQVSVVRGAQGEQTWCCEPLLDPIIDEAIDEALKCANPQRVSPPISQLFQSIVAQESRRPVVVASSLKVKLLRAKYEAMDAVDTPQDTALVLGDTQYPQPRPPAPRSPLSDAGDASTTRSTRVVLTVEDFEGGAHKFERVGDDIELPLPQAKAAPAPGSFSSKSLQFFEVMDPRRRSITVASLSRREDVSLVFLASKNEAAHERAVENVRQVVAKGAQLHGFHCGAGHRMAAAAALDADEAPPGHLPPATVRGPRTPQPPRPSVYRKRTSFTPNPGIAYAPVSTSASGIQLPVPLAPRLSLPAAPSPNPSPTTEDPPKWLAGGGTFESPRGYAEPDATAVVMGGGAACSMSMRVDLSDPAELVAGVRRCLEAKRSDGTHGYIPGLTPPPMAVLITVTEGSPMDCTGYKADVEAIIEPTTRHGPRCAVVCWRVESVSNPTNVIVPITPLITPRSPLSPSSSPRPRPRGSRNPVQSGSSSLFNTSFDGAASRSQLSGTGSSDAPNLLVTAVWSVGTGVCATTVEVDTTHVKPDAFNFRSALDQGMEGAGLFAHDLQAVGVFYNYVERGPGPAGRRRRQSSMGPDAPAGDADVQASAAAALEKHCGNQYRHVVGSNSAAPLFFVQSPVGESVVEARVAARTSINIDDAPEIDSDGDDDDQDRDLAGSSSTAIRSVPLPSLGLAASVGGGASRPGSAAVDLNASSSTATPSPRPPAGSGLSGTLTVLMFYREKPIASGRMKRDDLVLKFRAETDGGVVGPAFLGERTLRLRQRHLYVEPRDTICMGFKGLEGAATAEVGITATAAANVGSTQAGSVSPYLLRAMVNVGLGGRGLHAIEKATPAELADLFNMQLLHYDSRVYLLSLSGGRKMIAENIKHPKRTAAGDDLHATSPAEMPGATCAECRATIADDVFYYYFGERHKRIAVCRACAYLPHVMILERVCVPSPHQLASVLLRGMQTCKEEPVVVIENQGPLHLTNPGERDPMRLVFRNSETGFQWTPHDQNKHQRTGVDALVRGRAHPGPHVKTVELNSWLAPVLAPIYSLLVEALRRVPQRHGVVLRRCPQESVSLYPGNITVSNCLITAVGQGSHDGCFADFHDDAAHVRGSLDHTLEGLAGITASPFSGATKIVVPIVSRTGRGISLWSRFAREDEVMFTKGCFFQCGEGAGGVQLAELTARHAMRVRIRSMLLTVTRPVFVMLLTEVDRALASAAERGRPAALQVDSADGGMVISSADVVISLRPNAVWDDQMSRVLATHKAETLGDDGAALLTEVLRLRANIAAVVLRRQAIPWQGCARILDALRVNLHVRTVLVTEDDDPPPRDVGDVLCAIRLRLIFNAQVAAAGKAPYRQRPQISYGNIASACDGCTEGAWPAVFALAMHDVTRTMILNLANHPRATRQEMEDELVVRLLPYGAPCPEIQH